MAERGPESGDTPVGGSRRPSRPPRSALPEDSSRAEAPDPGDQWPAAVRPVIDKPPDDACPWLYLAADPDARAAFVTAEHRCEIRPDEVPGPGHQLAYCLTTNHISCPQLRNYEARRRAEAESVAAITPPAPSVAPRVPEPAVANFRESLIGGVSRGATGRSRGLMASRIAWAAMGAVGALVFAAGLVLYSSPDNVASSEPDTIPTALPPTVASTPDAPPVEATQPQTASDASSVGDTPTDAPEVTTSDGVGSDPTDLETLSALGPEPADGEIAGAPPDGATASDAVAPTPEPTPQPSYIVGPGDTLGQIAQDLGISVIDLAIANGITTDTLIFVGDRLLLPPVEEPAAAVPTPPAGELEPPTN